MRKSKVDDALRAVVLVELREGKSVRDIAAAHGISKTTVGRLKAQLVELLGEQGIRPSGTQDGTRDVDGTQSNRVISPNRINEKVARLAEAHLDCLIAAAEVGTDKTYLSKQDGADLAAISGNAWTQLVQLARGADATGGTSRGQAGALLGVESPAAEGEPPGGAV